MGFHKGLRALFFFILFLSCLIGSCCNSKITFPGEDDNSLTKSEIPTETPTPPSLSPSSSTESSLFSFFSDDNNSIDQEISNDGPSSFSDDTQVAEVKGFVRSLEVSDSSEVYNPDRKLRDEMDDNWNGWKFEDKNDRNRGWKYQNKIPNEKTISVQVLDNDPYHHGRPAWPHDEYLVGYFDLKNSPERSNLSNSDDGFGENNVESTISPEDVSKFYEWKRLQPRPSPSAFIGPGFYDVSSLGPSSSTDYYRYQQPSYHAITTDGTGKVQTTSKGSGGSSGEVTVPGTPSESTTNTRHFPGYLPYDFYKRKRLRLQIHPGLIAAPLAGLAAFGAASALTSKPLLVELGYVRNKPELIGGGLGGGWGLAGTPGAGYRPYPPFYPPPNPPPIYPPIGIGTGSVGPYYPPGPVGGGLGGLGGGLAHAGASHSAGGGGGGPIYPILKPIRHRPESERSSWWNPFSALTPRLVIE